MPRGELRMPTSIQYELEDLLPDVSAKVELAARWVLEERHVRFTLRDHL
jgi:hypothetical protein